MIALKKHTNACILCIVLYMYDSFFICVYRLHIFLSLILFNPLNVDWIVENIVCIYIGYEVMKHLKGQVWCSNNNNNSIRLNK